MKKLRIFISSPGDVQQERNIAKNLISEMSHVYSNYVELETIMWEDLPLEATGAFQSGIDYFLNQAPIDIAVFILWSRLGSTLGQSYKKADGTLYASGTEYEFDTMYALWEKTKKPRIIVYVKDAEIQFGNGLSSSRIKEILEQQDKLNLFIEEKFRDKETGTNYAYLQFDRQQTFEEKLRSHLNRLIQEHIGHDVRVREWEGNPYVGLKSYDSNESPIFCGRKDLTYQVIEKISAIHRDSNEPTLLVLGESGSGKSSIVKAGLFPYFQSISVGDRKYESIVVTPSGFGGNIYDGIVEILASSYPGLQSNPILSDLRNGIDDSFKFEYLAFAIRSLKQDHYPILFIDQFEEIFSDNSITEDERQRTLLLLRGLASTNIIWLIISMRNDFYSKFTTYSDFGCLKNDALVVDIPNISSTDIMEIVEEPARKANLKWEVNGRGLSLSKQIIQDAGEIKDLPLIEFALSELYNRCSEKEILTFEAYDAIGKLHGAVVNYADNFYRNLSEEEKTEFTNMLPSLVTISTDKEVHFVRKTTQKELLEKNECCRELIAKLIKAHLLISGKDINGKSTVSVVHEILISSWPIIREWTLSQKQFISQYDYYEKQAKHWSINGQKKYELIQERSSLLEAEYFLFSNEPKISNVVADFLRKSISYDQRKGLVKYIFGFAMGLLVLFSSLFVIIKGTTGDADMDETIGISNLKWWDIVLLYTPILIALFRSLRVRLAHRPKFETIARTSAIWGINACILLIGYVADVLSERDPWISLIMPCFILLFAVSPWLEHWRRLQWKKQVYVPYFTTDKFEVVKNTLTWIVVAVITVVLIALYSVIITEKNDKLEKATDVATECFDALNNLQDQLTWFDTQYLNTLRMNYLRTLYADELSDTIPDRYEGEFALCLYNLYEPYRALPYLYPNKYWDQHYTYIATCMRAGLYNRAESYIEQIAIFEKYHDYKWISTANLIWYAELCGRFDIAEKISEIVFENKPSQRDDVATAINMGHISLADGRYNDANDSYDRAVRLCYNLYPDASKHDVYDFVIRNIQNDMDIFRWLEIMDANHTNWVYNRYNLPIKYLYTHKSDSVETTNFISEVEGKWILSDSSIVMHYFDRHPATCQYIAYASDENGERKEVMRAMTQIRCARENGCLYLEEYDLNANQNSIIQGEIVELSNDLLSIRIVHNGNDNDKGTIRVYHRMLED